MRLLLHVDGQRLARQVLIFLAQVIADYAVDDADAVHFAGRGEDFAAGKIAPLVTTDDATGLDPVVVRVQRGREVAARGIGRANFFRLGDDVHHFAAERVDLVVVGAHAFQHDLLVDVDHVRVAHLAAVHDVGHLHARLQLVALHLDGEDADIAGFHVVGDLRRQVGQRAWRQVFQHERLEGRAQLRQLLSDAGGDLATGVVGDQRDLFARLNAKASVDRVVSARREFGIESSFGEIGENWLSQEQSFPESWF